MITLNTNTNSYNISEQKDELVKITWQELKDLRDNDQLIPGNFYRITDYQCTTIQENTRSAGHQFDIVLLALSENKLAEEGWAMMHPTDIYDMTFADGVRKVYILKNNDNECNIVGVETLLGFKNYIYHTDNGDPEVEVNWENHTATDLLGETFEQALTEENVPYNYFQNSNLSAWKVWYCLDNDKNRFDWADPGEYKIQVNTPKYGSLLMKRNPGGDETKDNVNYYNWINIDELPYHASVDVSTTEEIPSVGDKLYEIHGEIVDVSDTYSITEVVEPVALGRGVIYRLIDEFNNDCPYDFKNIQYSLSLDEGLYHPGSSEESWVYTFNVYHDEVCDDASIIGNRMLNDEGKVTGVFNNYISSVGAGVNLLCSFMLPRVTLLTTLEDNTTYYGLLNNSINSSNVLNLNFGTDSGTVIFYACYQGTFDLDSAGMYIYNKKVQTAP